MMVVLLFDIVLVIGNEGVLFIVDDDDDGRIAVLLFDIVLIIGNEGVLLDDDDDDDDDIIKLPTDDDGVEVGWWFEVGWGGGLGLIVDIVLSIWADNWAWEVKSLLKIGLAVA